MKRLVTMSMVMCLGLIAAPAMAQQAPKMPEKAQKAVDKAKDAGQEAKRGAEQAQDAAKKAGQPAAPDMKAMEEAWAKAGEVGPNHAIIAGFEGEWECAVKEYGMDGKVSESKGTSSNTMVLGGRFLSMDYNGRMNGKFFRGLGMLGYCNMNKRFEHLWTDSMSTHMDLMTGSADASGKTLTFTGEMPDPVSGASMKERMVLKIADKQSYAMEMYVDVGGKEMKMMEIAFTRASKGEKKGADKAAEKASDKAEKAADKAADKPKKGKD